MSKIKKPKIVCGKSFIKIYDIDKAKRDRIWEQFKFVDTKKKNNPSFRNKPWFDVHFRPYDRRSNIIGIGFLDYLLSFFDKNEWDYDFEDLREHEVLEEILENTTDEELDNMLSMDTREYQRDVVRKCLSVGSGLVQCSTGSGKTFMMALLIKLLNLPTLVVFNKVTLAHQTRKNFLSYGFDEKDLGIVQGSNFAPSKITFVTIGSYEKLLDYLHLYKVVVFDETHNVRANTYQEFLEIAPMDFRFGFSGTVFPENPADKARIIQYIGRMIYSEMSTKELIDQGYLAKPTVYMVECNREEDGEAIWEQSGKDYHNLYKQEIVENEYRNLLIASICAKKKNDKILVLYEIIKHGEKIEEILKEYFPERNISLLRGENSQQEREKEIEFFEKDDNGILIGSTILNEGIDIKSTNVVINASAGGGKTGGMIRIIQKLGRGIRIDEGKNMFEYYDFIDKNSRVFLDQSKKRMRVFEKEGHEIKKIKVD